MSEVNASNQPFVCDCSLLYNPEPIPASLSGTLMQTSNLKFEPIWYKLKIWLFWLSNMAKADRLQLIKHNLHFPRMQFQDKLVLLVQNNITSKNWTPLGTWGYSNLKPKSDYITSSFGLKVVEQLHLRPIQIRYHTFK